MKAAYLTNRYPGGSHTFIRRELLALERRGFEVHRYSIRRPDGLPADPVDRKELEQTQFLLGGSSLRLLIPLIALLVFRPRCFLRGLRGAIGLASNSSRGLLVHLAYLGEAAVLLRLTRQVGVTHVHAHFGTNPAAVAMLWRRIGGGTFSFMVHGPDEFERARDISLGNKVSEAAFVTGITTFCQSQIFRWSRLEDWSKVHVVPCGLDADFLNATVQPVPDSEALLWIGRIAEEKGIPILMEACSLLKQRGIRFKLKLAGDGGLRDETVQTIQERGLEDCVELLGWLNDEQVRVALAASRALVMSSFAEGLPVVIMESMALGRPVVTTRIAGIPELVEHGHSGWLVTPGSPLELADAMQLVLEAPIVKLQAVADLARERVRVRHSVDDAAASLHRLLAPWV